MEAAGSGDDDGGDDARTVAGMTGCSLDYLGVATVSIAGNSIGKILPLIGNAAA